MKSFYGSYNCPVCPAKTTNQASLDRHIVRRARRDPGHREAAMRLLKAVKNEY